MLIFEWDEQKNVANITKHGVSFEVASEVFKDPLSLTIADPDHSESEDRFVTIGMTQSATMAVVSHTDREGRVRIITARLATAKERKSYESN